MSSADLAKLVSAAEKACSNAAVVNSAEGQRAVDALNVLKQTPVTVATLTDTQAGRRIKKLTKHASSTISNAAKAVVEAWRTAVDQVRLNHRVACIHHRPHGKPGKGTHPQDGQWQHARTAEHRQPCQPCTERSRRNAHTPTKYENTTHMSQSLIPLCIRHTHTHRYCQCCGAGAPQPDRRPQARQGPHTAGRRSSGGAGGRPAWQHWGGRCGGGVCCAPAGRWERYPGARY